VKQHSDAADEFFAFWVSEACDRDAGNMELMSSGCRKVAMVSDSPDGGFVASRRCLVELSNADDGSSSLR
jgi:hypothetical protein